MTAPKPVIDVKGSAVLWRQGGTRKRFPTKSNAEAWALAARLEQAWEDEMVARLANYDLKLERGDDVVRRHPDTVPEPAPEPVTAPEPELVPEPANVDVTVEWNPDTERVSVTINSTTDATLWRTVGGRSSTFDVTGGDELVRSFKAVAGDEMVIRYDDDDGTVIGSTVFGDDYSWSPAVTPDPVD